MALWTTISNLLVGVGAKPFATTIQALRDNPVAIAEGATGAPRIRQVAFDALTAGSTYQSTLDSSDTATGTTAYRVLPVAARMLTSGVVTISASHQISGGGFTSFLRVMKNGVQQIEWSTTSTSLVARTVDVTVAIGDIITVEHRPTSAGQTSTVTNAKIGAANGNLWALEAAVP